MGIIRSISNLNTGLATIAVGLSVAAINMANISLPTYADTATGEAQSLGVGVTGSSVSISAAGSVSFEVIPSSSGSLGVGKTSVSVTTDSSSGYRLYVSGANYDANDTNHYTSLYYEGNSANTTSKIYGLPSTTATSFTTTSIYDTGEHTGTTADTYNHWGFAVPSDSTGSYASANDYDNIISSGTTIDSTTINNLKWKGVSANYTKVKEKNGSGTDTIDIYYGAYINNSLMTGTYKNTIVYTAFVEGSGKATVTPTAVVSGNTITITLDYQGTAINTDQVTVTLYDSANPSDDVATCYNTKVVSGTGVSNLLKITCDVYSGINDAVVNTLYDLRVDISNVNGVDLSYTGTDVFKFSKLTENAGDMQNASCSTLNEGTLYYMNDTRDSKKYLVGKLADGNCWMLQNLALDGETTISDTDSDLTNTTSYTLPASDQSALNNHWGSDTDTTGYMYNGTHKNAIKNTRVTASGTATANTGAYYSYVVATAGYTAATSTAAPNSICPKGWKLPISSQFETLYNAYDGSSNSSSISNLQKAMQIDNAYTGGCVTNGCPHSHDVIYLWSSSNISSTLAGRFYANSGGAYPTDRFYKRHGFSVRCILVSPAS